MSKSGGLVLATDIHKTANFIHWAQNNPLFLAIVGYGQLNRGIQLDEFAHGSVFGEESDLVFLTEFFDLGACKEVLSEEIDLSWHQDFTQLDNAVAEEKVHGHSGVTLPALEYLEKDEFWRRLSRQQQVAFVGSGATLPTKKEAVKERKEFWRKLAE